MAVAGDLITNVVASFVYEGIRRCYGALKSNIRRRQTIAHALDGVPNNNERPTAKAISDLELVIGTDRGELTEPVAQFIRELEATAIPDTVLKSVLSGIDTTPIFLAFDNVYGSFRLTLSFRSKAFFDALVEAIRQRAEMQVEDHGLLEFVQAQNSNLSDKLESILRALTLTAELPNDVPQDVLSDARLKIARSIETANRLMGVETLQ